MRVLRAIDYDSVRKTPGRALSSGVPERAWQMEFNKDIDACQVPW
ncbi:TPA: hypothetical protein N0F65_006781 [Lagenidium giganteum]|uniref:Uncharacterized protein n=1 Tax=Lagenidium giganteum TaxID=4803 RepID=A0AAV2ZDH2_9STRA|nr:TPA: hypothetical protein N0F65_006781 [Lagenidium giganteum]